MDHLPPATTVKRALRVVNNSSRHQRIDLYPAAASVDNGRFRFAEGRTGNELTSWISLDQDRVELAPGSAARFEATLAVPPSVEAGERYAVIWAAARSAPDESANVTQIHRVGVRVYLDIGMGAEPASDFAIGELVPARDRQGVPSVAIQVSNTGGRALDLGGSVELSEGPAGTRAGPFEATDDVTLTAGQSGTVTVRMPRDLPNGPWRIDVTLRSGTVHRTATGRVTFPDPGGVGRPSRLFERLGTRWGVIGGSLAVGLPVAAGLFVIARQRRHSRNRV